MVKHSLLLLFIPLLIGCASDKDQVIDDLRPEKEGKYSFAIFADENATKTEYYDKVTDVVVSLGDSVSSHSVFIKNEEDADEYKYDDVFNIKKYPVFIVFDSNGIVLKTYNTNELEQFFSD
ncbi:hypothetical protein [Salibacterium sp. K-3]